METAVILRYALLLGCTGMAMIALFYLRQRQLKDWEMLLWGTLAVCLPLLGPFLVISSRPGRRRRQPTQLRPRAHGPSPKQNEGGALFAFSPYKRKEE